MYIFILGISSVLCYAIKDYDLMFSKYTVKHIWPQPTGFTIVVVLVLSGKQML